jgi:hypothetical protein
MKKRGNILVIVLIAVIIILAGILAYGVYTGVRVKAELARLNGDIQGLTSEKQNLIAENDRISSDLKALRVNYDLLVKDVAKVYKTCINENVCKGHYPSVSWYCNNVGDEVSNPSHICVCDSACNLNATEINN